MKLRKIKKKVVDKELMEKRRNEADVIDDYEEVTEVEEMIKKAQEEWDEIVYKGKEIRENELLDYHHSEVIYKTEDQRKIKKKILSGIKKNMNKMHSFHYLSRHVGKGEREGIKRIHEVDDNNRIISIHVDRESIEIN